MNEGIIIDILSMLWIIVPVLGAIIILAINKVIVKNNIYAFFRMVLQLISVGYILNMVFFTKSSILVVGILILMLTISSYIAVRLVIKKHPVFIIYAFIALLLGAGSSLIFVTQVVLKISPWYQPSSLIPLAGMLFFTALNVMSLAVERYYSELSSGTEKEDAHITALKVAIIPIMNTFFAAGIVSLPGFMTGQILSGVSPLIAVRYQIIMLSMIFCSQVFSVYIFLRLIKHKNYSS